MDYFNTIYNVKKPKENVDGLKMFWRNTIFNNNDTPEQQKKKEKNIIKRIKRIKNKKIKWLFRVNKKQYEKENEKKKNDDNKNNEKKNDDNKNNEKKNDDNKNNEKKNDFSVPLDEGRKTIVNEIAVEANDPANEQEERLNKKIDRLENLSKLMDLEKPIEERKEKEYEKLNEYESKLKISSPEEKKQLKIIKDFIKYDTKQNNIKEN